MDDLRLFGIETEYGITREDCPEMDPVVESMELVRAYLQGPFQRKWDYHWEHPQVDQRGFRVKELAQDQEETLFAEQDAHRPFSFYDMKSDLVLPNGARFYNDHTHPEYSTPECRSLKDVVAHDRAGERILLDAAKRRNALLGEGKVQLYKNNSDFQGHSYGCHDNYLVSRSIEFQSLVDGLLPFLVSRQIIAGAGKVGREKQEAGYQPGGFQLSQRADFMEQELGVDTMHNRSILNTRDEPHADRTRFRRLHLIVGDANMSEYATALKVGTTRLVLDLIARNQAPLVHLESPVHAIQALSQDTELKTVVSRKGGQTISGVDLQRVYLAAAHRELSGGDPETRWILQEWERTLEQLESDRMSLVGKLDWVTKQWFLDTFRQEEGLEWEDPWLKSLDLEYHNIDPERGLFYGLEAEGRTTRLCEESDIQRAIGFGPEDTRGGLRGACVRQFPQYLDSVQWERVTFRQGDKTLVFDLGDVVDLASVAHHYGVLKNAQKPEDFCSFV